MDQFYKLLAKMLTLPIPTIAAIQGHAFAGGCLLSLAHDHRIMNEERGFLCMNELEIGFGLTGPLNELMRDKLPRHVAARMLCEAQRIGAKEALSEKVISGTAKGDAAVFEEAIKLANKLSKGATSPALKQLKSDIYCAAVSALMAPPPTIDKSKL